MGEIKAWETAVGSVALPLWMVRWEAMVDAGIECEVVRRLRSFSGVRTTGEGLDWLRSGKEGLLTCCAPVSSSECGGENCSRTASCCAKEGDSLLVGRHGGIGDALEGLCVDVE